MPRFAASVRGGQGRQGLEVEGVYESRALKLSRELPPEGQKVTVTIRPAGSAVERFYGSVRWAGEPEELRRFLDDPEASHWGSRDV
jgi:hypothetical protein